MLKNDQFLDQNYSSHKINSLGLTLMPKVTMVGGNVVCDGKVIPTRRKPLMQELFRIFIDNPHRRLYRHELRNLIYTDCQGDLSSRLRESQNHNIVKLISRARALAKHYTNPRSSGGINWFHPHRDENFWCFFSVGIDYLEDRQRRMETYLQRLTMS